MVIDDELFAGALAVVFPVAFAAFVFLRRSRPFPGWAKGVAVAAAIAGITSAVLSFVLLHHRDFGLSTPARFNLLGTKHTLDGIVIGFVLSVVFACMRTVPGRSGEREV
jgi:Na+/proline symporter